MNGNGASKSVDAGWFVNLKSSVSGDSNLTRMFLHRELVLNLGGIIVPCYYLVSFYNWRKNSCGGCKLDFPTTKIIPVAYWVCRNLVYFYMWRKNEKSLRLVNV